MTFWAVAIDIITGLSTLFLVIATFLYFIQTRNLVRENREMREFISRPKVIVNYELHKGKISIYDFVIKNLGNSTAKCVKLEMENDLECFNGNFLSESKIFQDGIECLVPQQEVRMFLNLSRNIIDGEGGKIYRGRVIYEDLKGEIYEEKFALDFSYQVDLVQIKETKELEDIVEKIRKDIHKISKNIKEKSA